MKKEEFQTKIDEITKKIGDEASNLVLDDIGMLLNDNSQMNAEIDKRDKEIENLKARNEMLQTVNGNLLQQVSVGIIEKPTIPKKEETKPFDFRTAFDEKRKF